jgi:GNAT superfamily N-acetyltransferase
MTITIERRLAGSGAICQAILAGLPGWFGLPESNAAYAGEAQNGPTWIASEADDPLGLMILKPHFAALEIHLLAVRADRRGQGLGRRLVAAAEAEARRRGARFVTVKTRGPSRPSSHYAETRAFYDAVGFWPIEEIDEIWGPENPCLYMVRPL